MPGYRRDDGWQICETQGLCEALERRCKEQNIDRQLPTNGTLGTLGQIGFSEESLDTAILQSQGRCEIDNVQVKNY